MVGLRSQKITEFGSSQATVREPHHDVPLNRDTPFSRYRMVGWFYPTILLLYTHYTSIFIAQKMDKMVNQTWLWTITIFITVNRL